MLCLREDTLERKEVLKRIDDLLKPKEKQEWLPYKKWKEKQKREYIIKNPDILDEQQKDLMHEKKLIKAKFYRRFK